VFAGDKIISYSEKPFRGSMERGTALARKEKKKRKEDYGDRQGRGGEGEPRRNSPTPCPAYAICVIK